MFAPRYFAPRYFAPRYWATGGVEAPTTEGPPPPPLGDYGSGWGIQLQQHMARGTGPYAPRKGPPASRPSKSRSVTRSRRGGNPNRRR